MVPDFNAGLGPCDWWGRVSAAEGWRFVVLDRMGTVVEWADGGASLFGVPRERAIGRPPVEFLPGWLADRIADLRADSHACRSLSSKTFNHDGAEFEAVAHGPAGGPTVLFFRKVGSQSSLEDCRSDRLLLDFLPAHALLIGSDRRILAANRAARSLGAHPGGLCHAALAKLDEPCPWCLAPEALSTGAPRRAEARPAHAAWDVHWVPLGRDRFLHYIFDITALKRDEDALRNTLAAKDTAIREIHHRVKNNFMVVQGLLNLKSYAIADPLAKEGLIECATRVRSMCLVHEHLYRHPASGRVDFAEYLSGLIQSLKDTYKEDAEHVSVSLDAAECQLHVDTATTCGLVANELISNAFKHAFERKRGGALAVRAEDLGGRTFALSVIDDGRGLPEGFDPAASGGFGMQLVATLTRQMGGVLTTSSGHGAAFRLVFKDKGP